MSVKSGSRSKPRHEPLPPDVKPINAERAAEYLALLTANLALLGRKMPGLVLTSTLALARTALVRSASNCGKAEALDRVTAQLRQSGQWRPGQWLKVGEGLQAGFILINDQGDSAEFRPALPADVQVGEVLVCPDLEASIDPRDYLSTLAHFACKELDKRSAKSRAAFSAAKSAFNACDGSRLANRWQEFRRRMSNEIRRAGSFESVKKDALESVTRAHQRFEIDGEFFAGFLVLMAASENSREVAQLVLLSDWTGDEFKVLPELARPPSALRDAVVASRIAISRGEANSLMQVADLFADQGASMVNQALDSETDHAGLLFGAAPWMLAANLLTEAVVHWPVGFGVSESVKGDARRRAYASEERAVRIEDSLAAAWHVELHGGGFEMWRARVASVARAEGLLAAERLVSELIELRYLYPRNAHDRLLQGIDGS